ncbi:MAG: phospho-N-acetylmuramoyl-pentapeptide-transferase [Spirochaetota bacterium]|nr:phospho-N-acetylmuramoyl-pentapeptide-transferase [Spirochaetota bacterium]
MFYHFLLPLQEYISYLRLFQYITFRSAYAALTALLLVLIFGNMMIRWLKRLKFNEQIYEHSPDSHKSKAGTPTMGGMIILITVFISIGLWGNFYNHYLVILTAATILLGVVGFIDDYMKSVLRKNNGLSALFKIISQIVIALGVSLLVYFYPSNEVYTTTLFIPFFNEAVLNMMWLWIVFATIVIVGSSNAVNLTDGLDGIAIGSVITVAVSLGIMAYLSGHIKLAAYLKIPFIPHSAELTVFLSAVVGASIGFLWFNCNPASVFMGDTGSLSLGGIVGIVAIMIKKEIFLFIVGGVFVIEAISVIIQVVSFKLRGKRVFKMAPIHHHFELSGWPEQKVVVRMWILGIILAILGLSSLKLL